MILTARSIDVVGEAADGAEAVAMARRLLPAGSLCIYAALAAGASGFLKDVTPEHLTAAVRLVNTGDALLAPSITRRLVERFAAGESTPTIHRNLATLTPRELEVLTLMGRGLSNAELASALTISEATAKTHVARIFAKLRLRDRAQAVVLGYETGLISPGGPRSP